MKKAISRLAAVLLLLLASGEFRINAQTPLYVVPNAAEVGVGAELQLYAFQPTSLNPRQWPPTAAAASWTSSDRSIATVDRFGRVKGVALGSVRIVATVSGKKAAATIKVGAPVARIWAPYGLDLVQNCAGSLTVRLEDAQGHPLHNRPIQWKSNAPNIARVPVVASLPANILDLQGRRSAHSIAANEFLLSPSRTILAVAPGKAIITATSKGMDGKTGVNEGKTVVSVSSGIEIQPPSIVLDVAEDAPVVPIVRACGIAGVPPLTWTLSNPSVALFDPTALKVMGRATGQTMLTAQAANGLTGNVSVTVPAVASVFLSESFVTLEIGQEQYLYAQPVSADHRNLKNRFLKWEASTNAVTLSSTYGYITRVTGQNAGTATVKATSENGVYSTAVFTVNGPPPPPPPTCSGAAAGPGVMNFDVAIASWCGCGASVTYRANSYTEAKKCASDAGYTVVSKLCNFDVHVEDDPLYDVWVWSPTDSDAINCVRVNVCGNCNLYILANAGCLSF